MLADVPEWRFRTALAFESIPMGLDMHPVLELKIVALERPPPQTSPIPPLPNVQYACCTHHGLYSVLVWCSQQYMLLITVLVCSHASLVPAVVHLHNAN